MAPGVVDRGLVRAERRRPDGALVHPVFEEEGITQPSSTREETRHGLVGTQLLRDTDHRHRAQDLKKLRYKIYALEKKIIEKF